MIPPHYKAYSDKAVGLVVLSFEVMSSCLCKNPEGAVFPFQVKALEDGINDAIDALDVHKAHHRPSAPSYLNETTLDDIGGAQFSPQVPGKAEEGQQLWQVALQLSHH